jgi:4-diphosphocytidyl-2-C-methyl-D-erythritol kinase
MIVRTVAPAKINWTLEVLGKRPDGYHEIKSVMQTIDLCDEVEVSKEPGSRNEERGSSVKAGSAALVVDGEGHEATEQDLTLRAVRALEEATGRKLPVSIGLIKRIPLAAGLGGGSSDAAAVLRAMDRLYELGLSRERLAEIGATVGSDVPFFAYGGTALSEGRGERVTALPDVRLAWLLILDPRFLVQEKTKRLYEALNSGNWSAGALSSALAERLNSNISVGCGGITNAFERPALEIFPGLRKHRDAMRDAGAPAVFLAGAGPALCSVFDSRRAASAVGDRIAADARVFVVHTLTSAEATRVQLSGV